MQNFNAIFGEYANFIVETKQEECRKHREFTSKLFLIKTKEGERVTSYWSQCVNCYEDSLYDPTPEQLRKRIKEDRDYRENKMLTQQSREVFNSSRDSQEY